MSTRFRLPGGDLEHTVLAQLWELGSASARDIQTQVGEPQGLVYDTTAKVLDQLHAKRLVSRERKGMAFSYRPRVARPLVEAARARAFLTRLLGPAPGSAVATLMDVVESLRSEAARLAHGHRQPAEVITWNVNPACSC